MPADAWAPHPHGTPGNTSVRLVSADGGENNRLDGDMRVTPHLARAPYIRQVLASFAVPWSRTRLLRLAPGAGVPKHADTNYHWFYRVRVHIPVITREEVRFHCDGESVHMAAGEAWVFDNWRLHHVVNPTPDERIHLVGDTAGNAAFWRCPRSRRRSISHRRSRHSEPRAISCSATRTPLAPIRYRHCVPPGAVPNRISRGLRSSSARRADLPRRSAPCCCGGRQRRGSHSARAFCGPKDPYLSRQYG